MIRSDAVAFQRSLQELPVPVAADTADEWCFGAELDQRSGLIGSLATGGVGIAGAGDQLTGLGDLICAIQGQVQIQTPDDQNFRHVRALL